MAPLFSIGESGLSAAEARLGVAAQNVAAAPQDEPPAPGPNAAPAQAPALSLVQFSLPDGGVGTDVEAAGPDDPVTDVLNQLMALQAFKANLRVFQAGEAMTKSVLDLDA